MNFYSDYHVPENDNLAIRRGGQGQTNTHNYIEGIGRETCNSVPTHTNIFLKKCNIKVYGSFFVRRVQ